MKGRRHFVVLTGQRGEPWPMGDYDDGGGFNLALFDSEAEATRAAEQNMLGAAYGFDVYAWEPGL